MPSSEWIAIGIVRRPIGLQGFCAIEPFGAAWAALQPPCEVRIGKNIVGAESMVIDEVVSLPNGYRCRFGAKSDRAAVEGLRGSFIYIERKALPGLREGSFYHFELKGAEVYADTSGDRIGTVIEVHNFPAADTLEVQQASGGDSLLLPLSGQAIAAVDTAGRRITVRQSFVEELLQ